MMVEDDAGSDAQADDPDERLNALLEGAQAELRRVVQQVVAAARNDVEAAAEAVAERETEVAALQAAVAAERLHLVADRKALVKDVTEIRERERAVGVAEAEVAQLRDQATVELANALERSAQLIEQAEINAREHEARSRAKAEAELRSAREKVADTHAHLARRLEAVGTESEAILQRAVDRGLIIVSEAEASAERSKAELRKIVEQIQQYLDREKMQIELETETQIDLRDPPAAAPVTKNTLLEPPVPTPEPPEPTEAAPVLVPFSVSSAAAKVDPPTPEPSDVEADEDRVAEIVRRAVRKWSVSTRSAD